MTEQGLSLQELSFSFPAYGPGAPAEILRGLDLQCARGTFGVVLGGADGGKTTLARIIAGLIPRFTGGSLSGRISFMGMDLPALKPYQIMERVGLVFQNPDEQIISTRCDTEAAFALESLGLPREEMRTRVDAALELMGMTSFRSRNPATLSGGEKKRLLLACLAAVEPDLWILDEALEEVDAQWRSVLMDHLRAGNRTALFLDSRWSPLFQDHASRVFLLKGGRAESLQAAPRGLEEEGFVLPREPIPPTEVPSADNVLSARDLSFSFPGEESFRLDVKEMELRSGEVCALLGKNGSGKSTLGKLLCGLLAPQSGAVRVSTARGPVPEPLSRRVGYMFQNPDYQIFLPTVFEELSYGLKSAGLAGREIREKVEEAIALFRLPTADSPPALMSYGARKRLQAAAYHLLRRDFLILDEVDSGLSYGEFLPLLSAIRAGGAGLIIVTHDEGLAQAVAQRILVMEGGRIVSSTAQASARKPGGGG